MQWLHISYGESIGMNLNIGCGKKKILCVLCVKATAQNIWSKDRVFGNVKEMMTLISRNEPPATKCEA